MRAQVKRRGLQAGELAMLAILGGLVGGFVSVSSLAIGAVPPGVPSVFALIGLLASMCLGVGGIAGVLLIAISELRPTKASEGDPGTRELSTPAKRDLGALTMFGLATIWLAAGLIMPLSPAGERLTLGIVVLFVVGPLAGFVGSVLLARSRWLKLALPAGGGAAAAVVLYLAYSLGQGTPGSSGMDRGRQQVGHFWEIDRCLDRGRAWDYERERCAEVDD